MGTQGLSSSARASKGRIAARRPRGEDRSPSIEFSLLGLLAERPMHGYMLYRELCRKSGLGLVWTVKQAQLYGILSRLEAAGLVASDVVASGQGPVRKVFRTTAAGRAAFAKWARSPASRRDFRLDFLAKLFFARKAGGRAAFALVSAQRRECEFWLSDMRSRISSCEPSGLDALVYRYRIGQLEATASWLDECEAYFGTASRKGGAP